jgi:hypothetical protein
MRMIRMIGFLLAVALASSIAMTPAFACPRGYAPAAAPAVPPVDLIGCVGGVL